ALPIPPYDRQAPANERMLRVHDDDMAKEVRLRSDYPCLLLVFLRSDWSPGSSWATGSPAALVMLLDDRRDLGCPVVGRPILDQEQRLGCLREHPAQEFDVAGRVQPPAEVLDQPE